MGIALGTDTARSSEEEDCDTGADRSAVAADANADAAGLVLQVQVEDDEVDEALPVLLDEDYGVGDDGPGSERDVPPSSSDNEDNEQAVSEQPARGVKAQVAVSDAQQHPTPNTPPTRIVRARTQTVTPPQQEQQRQFLDGMGAILDGQAQQTLATQTQLQQQQQQFEERMRQQHEDKDAREQERHQQFVMTMQQSMMTFQGTLMQNHFGRRRRHASSSDSD
ncbi:forkhead box protein P2-like [Sycon ciliatum]|uniref:forkhead box protein P2-like n=1 Tax=Sycon ciliatum TaxID=27933 RepID=UPI0031F695D0